jgi:integrase
MASTEKHTRTDGVTTYRVKWREGGRNGRPQTFTFDGPKAAERFKDLVTGNGNRLPTPAALREAGFGFLPEAADPVVEPARITLVECVNAYLGERRTIRGAGKETRGDYESYRRLYVEPFFGQMAIVDVHRRQLDDWQHWMTSEKGLSRKTVANVRGSILNPVLQRAMMRGDDGEPALRDYNPLVGLPLPDRSGVRFERPMLESAAEAEILLAAALAVDEDAHDLLLCQLGLGLRWGEVAALPPWAVSVEPDTFKGVAHVEQVAVRRRAAAPGVPAWYIRQFPKTPAGFRRFPFGARIGRMLHRRLATAGELVFTNTAGKLWYYATFHDNRWKPIMKLAKANGLPHDISTHGLRKSLISVLYESNVDPVTVAEVSGHEDPSTGLKFYTKATDRNHDAIRAAAARLLGDDHAAA